MENNKGFTLIEVLTILVLVSIIICLAAAVALIVILKNQKATVYDDNYTAIFEDESSELLQNEGTIQEEENNE